MGVDRRQFIRWGAGAAAAAVLARPLAGQAGREGPGHPGDVPDHVGCLVDTTLCIGCRKCEEACNRRNGLPRPDLPFADVTVFREERRPTDKAFTVVNAYRGAPSADQPAAAQTFVKFQCLHCLTPSCVSACIVGAMVKAADGSVVYNPDICLGCRYCMVACPFQIPAYEYDVALKPLVRKCQFCADRDKGTGADPACAAACPTEALVFGERRTLLALARGRIEKRPDRYLDKIYGEREAGGTSWLYLTGRPGREVGLLDLPASAPARVTESIQHGIFRYGLIPLSVFGLLGGIMWFSQRRARSGGANAGKDAAHD